MANNGWVQRRTKRSKIKHVKTSIFIRVLDAYVDIEESAVQCAACKEVLHRDFCTMPCKHSSCTECIRKCFKDEVYSCPTCREKTQDIQYQDPILKEVLRVYPRSVPCGHVCDGFDSADEHIKTCLGCARAKHMELQREYDALKLHTDAISTKAAMVEEANSLLREELKKYTDMYGEIEEESDTEILDD